MTDLMSIKLSRTNRHTLALMAFTDRTIRELINAGKILSVAP